MKNSCRFVLPVLLCCLAPLAANAQSFRVQCPPTTITHPNVVTSTQGEPAYTGPTQFTVPGGSGITQSGFYTPTAGTVNGAIKCQQVSGGDGFMTEADGTQTFMFSFGPLSGLADIAAGLPGTEFPDVFNFPWPGCVSSGGVASATVVLGGTGYMVGDTISLTGGAGSGAVAKVLTITGTGLTGPVATVTISSPGSGYVSVTGNTTLTGSGSGATFAATLTNYCATPLLRGDPATTDGATSGATPGTPAFTWNGAVGLTPDISGLVTVSNLQEGPVLAPATVPGCPTTTASANTVTAWTDAPLGLPAGAQVLITNATAEGGTTTPPGYAGTWTITCVANNNGVVSGAAVTPGTTQFNEFAFQYVATTAGLASDTGNDVAATAASPAALDGHVDPQEIMNIGVMNGNIPGPLVAFDEDDEMFLTLTNVGMIQRPDLFEQHTFHFHGYPNASSFYDGVPDASIAINIGASFTYYYMAPDAGTYFYHCHITPPEHLQMGMVNQLHVRPRQDRVPLTGNLYTYLGLQNGLNCTAATASSCTPLTTSPAPDLRTECNPGRDILCSATMPSTPNAVTTGRSATVPTSGVQGNDLLKNPQRYTYNDGDGSTAYDVEYPIQMHGFDPNFHFVGMTFNPEMFVDMKDKYFLLNGRSYPDTTAPGPQATITTDGAIHYSQPLPAVINIPVGGKALLRMVNLSVTEYHTLQSVGIPMLEVGFMAKLLRDQAGNNTEFYTNSITLGGGESLDVILDASDASCAAFAGPNCSAKLYPANSTFYLYTPQLDHLSNDAENFGGMMTEVHICNSVTGPTPNPATQYPNPPGGTFGNTCN